MAYNHPYPNILISGRHHLDNCFWIACRLCLIQVYSPILHVSFDLIVSEQKDYVRVGKQNISPKGVQVLNAELHPPRLSHRWSGRQSCLSARWSTCSTLFKGVTQACRPTKNLFLILPLGFLTSASCLGVHTSQMCCGLGGRSRQSKPSFP